MAIETERKFLIRNDSWKKAVMRSVLMRQGYLCRNSDHTTVRIRIAGEKGFLTIKSPKDHLSRLEFEYEIPVEEAAQMLDTLCPEPLIEKRRSYVQTESGVWEIDEFSGENAGLVLAEIELPSAETKIVLPGWIGEEVSSDPRYYNSNLIKNPYKSW